MRLLATINCLAARRVCPSAQTLEKLHYTVRLPGPLANIAVKQPAVEFLPAVPQVQTKHQLHQLQNPSSSHFLTFNKIVHQLHNMSK